MPHPNLDTPDLVPTAGISHYGSHQEDAVVFPSIPPTEALVQDNLVPDAATPATPVAQPRYAHVDSLRALAALLVVWAHTVEVFAALGNNYVGAAGESVARVTGLWMNDISHAFDFGRIGVVVFFAISGFVVPVSLKGGRIEGLRRFFVSRVFRLYPAYWLSVPLGAITFYWMWNKPFGIYDFLANLTMLPAKLHAQPAMGLYWTLATEIFFYLLCALLFYFGKLRQVRVLALLVVLGLGLFMLKRASSTGLLGAHLSIMFFGTLCRYYFESAREASLSRRLQIFLLGYAAAWATLICIAWVGMTWMDWKPGAFLVLRTYGLGVGIFCAGLTVARMQWRFTAWLGQISYSLYLLHPFVLYLGLWMLLRWAPTEVYGLHLGFYVGSVAAVTIILAAITYHYIELPMIRLGKCISHRAPANVARATQESFP